MKIGYSECIPPYLGVSAKECIRLMPGVSHGTNLLAVRALCWGQPPTKSWWTPQLLMNDDLVLLLYTQMLPEGFHRNGWRWHILLRTCRTHHPSHASGNVPVFSPAMITTCQIHNCHSDITVVSNLSSRKLIWTQRCSNVINRHRTSQNSITHVIFSEELCF